MFDDQAYGTNPLSNMPEEAKNALRAVVGKIAASAEAQLDVTIETFREVFERGEIIDPETRFSLLVTAMRSLGMADPSRLYLIASAAVYREIQSTELDKALAEGVEG